MKMTWKELMTWVENEDAEEEYEEEICEEGPHWANEEAYIASTVLDWLLTLCIVAMAAVLIVGIISCVSYVVDAKFVTRIFETAYEFVALHLSVLGLATVVVISAVCTSAVVTANQRIITGQITTDLRKKIMPRHAK